MAEALGLVLMSRAMILSLAQMGATFTIYAQTSFPSISGGDAGTDNDDEPSEITSYERK